MTTSYQFGCAVEGDGETSAVPALLQRLGNHFCPGLFQRNAEISRIDSGKMRVEQEIDRYLELLARRVGRDSPFLILFDGDLLGDCAKELNVAVLENVRKAHADLRVSVVVATAEFEAWFLASKKSLVDKGIFKKDPCPNQGAESMRSPKALVGAALGRKYRETIDQHDLVREMSIDEAYANSRSFRKLCDDFKRLICPDEDAENGEGEQPESNSEMGVV